MVSSFRTFQGLDERERVNGACQTGTLFLRHIYAVRRSEETRFFAPAGHRVFCWRSQRYIDFRNEPNRVGPDLLFRRNHFGVDGDGDFIADHTWAVGDAKVLASDFGAGVNADALIAPGILN